jgi:Zn-dependent peptidase ImmA (M78 family)
MIRVPVGPEMLRWARERASLDVSDLRRRFPKLAAWEAGDASPTLKQLESFSRAVCVPIGYLFLSAPPIEQLPIPDFRSGRARKHDRPSPNLLDTIYMCQGRQEWYKEFSQISGEPPRAFVGALTIDSPIESAAATIRDAIGFDLNARRDCSTWIETLRMFIAQAESAGILVMCSGVVYNNTHRVLDPDEFRGFAIADPLAPLVFINGADTKSAQMFTLAHELGHLWLGRSALTDVAPSTPPSGDVEAWCNRVAAELLVPADVLKTELVRGELVVDTTTRLARRFKVSTLVILRRLLDINALSRARFTAEYEKELERILALARGSGGNFYLSEGARVSKRFAAALIESTLEGQTLYRDAMQMLGIKKLETFTEFARHLGIAA